MWIKFSSALTTVRLGWVTPQKAKYRITICYRNPTVRNIPKYIERDVSVGKGTCHKA